MLIFIRRRAARAETYRLGVLGVLHEPLRRLQIFLDGVSPAVPQGVEVILDLHADPVNHLPTRGNDSQHPSDMAGVQTEGNRTDEGEDVPRECSRRHLRARY